MITTFKYKDCSIKNLYKNEYKKYPLTNCDILGNLVLQFFKNSALTGIITNAKAITKTLRPRLGTESTAINPALSKC